LSDGSKVPAAGLGKNTIQSKPGVLSTSDTSGGSDLIVGTDTSGKPDATQKNPGPRVVGRQSWRQVH